MQPFWTNRRAPTTGVSGRLTDGSTLLVWAAAAGPSATTTPSAGMLSLIGGRKRDTPRAISRPITS